MIDIYVLNRNLKRVGILDNYSSLIWATRYDQNGDCEITVEATSEMLNLLKKNYYLVRDDDDMVCQIKKIELDTSSEEGNLLIITGVDVKNFVNQRVIWGTSSVNGNVEDYLRENVEKTLCAPNLYARQLRKYNGERMLYLGNKANFTEVTQEQNSYKNVGELIREKCKQFGWGYKIILDNELLYFLLYKGTDRSQSVIFADEYENLISTKYVDDSTSLGNVALVAGEGEGSERSRNVSGYAEGVNRYEIYVDAKDISKTIKWSDLIALYPTVDAGGQGSIKKVTNPNGTIYFEYQMNYIDILIVDENQLEELKKNYAGGTEHTATDGNKYFRVYNVAIADLPSDTLEESDDVVLREILYSVYLLGRGYEKLAEYGSVISFEGTVEPATTFIYKRDYFLGDKISVRNEFGISATARIVEVVEVLDNNGYRIEPKFEYIDYISNLVGVSGYLLTQKKEKIKTENYDPLLAQNEDTV